jgi:hypothetical protein
MMDLNLFGGLLFFCLVPHNVLLVNPKIDLWKLSFKPSRFPNEVEMIYTKIPNYFLYYFQFLMISAWNTACCGKILESRLQEGIVKNLPYFFLESGDLLFNQKKVKNGEIEGIFRSQCWISKLRIPQSKHFSRVLRFGTFISGTRAETQSGIVKSRLNEGKKMNGRGWELPLLRQKRS